MFVFVFVFVFVVSEIYSYDIESEFKIGVLVRVLSRGVQIFMLLG